LKPYAWIFFDADGTLFDFERAEATALSEALAELSLPVDPELMSCYHQVNGGLWKMLERGEITRADLQLLRFERLFRENGIAGDAAAMNRAYIRRLSCHGEMLPHAESVVKALAGHCPLALMTNGTAAVQEGRLAASPIRDCFRHVFISEKIGFAKPSAAYFDACFAALGWPDRKKCLLVGDSLSADMAGGMRYGMKTCWFNPERRPVPAGMKMDFVIGDLRALLEE